MPEASFNTTTKAKPTWTPTSDQLKAKECDERDIQQMVDYRSKFTPQWDRAIRAWNLLAEPIDDPDVSNVLFPLARMLCTASLTAMSKGRPGFGIRPGGPSDYKKVDLIWKPAIDSVLSECNYDAQQDYFLTDWEVAGNGVLEVYSQNPTKSCRVLKSGSPLSAPEYDTVVTRDFSRPRLGVRYRSPYECGISPNARTPEDAPSCFFQEAMSKDQFDQNYTHVKLPDGTPQFMNCAHVEGGKIVAIGPDSQLLFRESDYKGVIVLTYQNKLKDVYRQWANGVLILDKPLKRDRKKNQGGANVLGETTLCFAPNWHQYDDNGKTHALYGMGDPHLIRGLDILYQAFSNMTVDNMVMANTNVLSFKGMQAISGGEEQLTVKDMYSGYIMKNGGEVISSPLGTVSLSNYSWFREFLEESAMYLGRNNFKQLVGDTQSTAYEVFQKTQAQNEGFEFRLKKIENGAGKKVGRLLLAGVMSDLTIPDFEEMSEQEVLDTIDRIGAKQDSEQNYENLLSEDPANPPKRKMYYQIRTPGRVYTEKSTNGKYGADSLQEDDRYRGKQDGFIPAREEYVVSQEYAERGGIPDIYMESKKMLGDNQNVNMAKTKLLAEYARARITESLQVEQLATDFNMKEIDAMLVEALDVPKDRAMKKTDPASETNGEVDSILAQINDFFKPVSLSSQSDVTADPAAAGAPQPPRAAAPTPDVEGFTPFGRSAGRPQASVGLTATGAA